MIIFASIILKTNDIEKDDHSGIIHAIIPRHDDTIQGEQQQDTRVFIISYRGRLNLNHTHIIKASWSYPWRARGPLLSL